MAIDMDTNANKRNVLLLYCGYCVLPLAISEHLESFKKYSRHNLFYLHASHDVERKIDLNIFDVVIVHYSLRMCFESGGVLSSSFATELKHFKGHKILFIQDEYDLTNVTIDRIKSFNIHTVFTCVPSQYIEKIYPKEKLPGVEFISVLTGYVSENLLEKSSSVLPIHNRYKYIAYRGRSLPFWYGKLAQEKEEIGKKMRQFCEAKNIPVDIEWAEEYRIYGDKWYEFLASAKATLGTESGSNLFDFDGKVRELAQKILKNNPNMAFSEIYNIHLKSYDNYIQMNQISPKIFEAIGLKTALILYEGNYSGIIQPNVHYIPLKKDYSNLEEVFEKLQDDNFLQQMVECAYQDIILSNKYSYKSFIELVDKHIDRQKKHTSIHENFTVFLLPDSTRSQIIKDNNYCSLANLPSASITNILNPSPAFFIKVQRELPASAREIISPMLEPERVSLSVDLKAILRKTINKLRGYSWFKYFIILLKCKRPRFANFLLRIYNKIAF